MLTNYLINFIFNSIHKQNNTLTYIKNVNDAGNPLKYYMDIVDYSKEATTDIFLDNDNEQDVLNTQLAVANRMIEKLRSGTLYLDKYQLDGSASCEPFMDRFENQIAGWATTFTILVQNDIDNEV